MSDENMVPEIILTKALEDLSIAQDTIIQLTNTNNDLLKKLEEQTSVFLSSKEDVKAAVSAASQILKTISEGIIRVEMSEKDKKKAELLAKKETIERELEITAKELDSL